MAQTVNNQTAHKFEFVCKVSENLHEKIYSASFFEYGDDSTNHILATVSSTHATVYELNQQNGSVSCLQSYADDAWDESLYCCTFPVDKKTSAPFLIVAGELGVIKVMDCHTQKLKRALPGHGYRINYLLNHPLDNNIIISCSDDQSLRIWNIENGHCLAIISGHDGHRAAVSGCDVHQNGKLLISCGQDHAIKIWDLKDIEKWIEESNQISNENSKDTKSQKEYKTKMVQFPVYSKQKIHTNYVDHICWFGDLVISKSIESMMKIWIPPLDDFEKSVKTIGELRYEDGEEYFIRFAVDYVHRVVACGDRKGSIYIFDLDAYFSANAQDMGGDEQGDVDLDKEEQWHMMLHPKFVSKYEPIKLKLNDCDVPVRCVRFNRLGDLVAVTDDGTIYRYRKSVEQQ